MFTQQQAAGVRGQVLVPVISLILNVFMIARDTVQTKIEISVLVQTCMVYRHRQSHVLIAVPVSTIIIIDNQLQILLLLTSPMAFISTQSKTFKHHSRCLLHLAQKTTYFESTFCSKTPVNHNTYWSRKWQVNFNSLSASWRPLGSLVVMVTLQCNMRVWHPH